jgi:hypothetical protein
MVDSPRPPEWSGRTLLSWSVLRKRCVLGIPGKLEALKLAPRTGHTGMAQMRIFVEANPRGWCSMFPPGSRDRRVLTILIQMLVEVFMALWVLRWSCGASLPSKQAIACHLVVPSGIKPEDSVASPKPEIQSQTVLQKDKSSP